MKKQYLIGILGAVLSLSITACGNEKVSVYQSTDFAMGTVINQTVYGGDPQQYTADIMTALKDMEENQISWRESSSQIAKVNEAAGSGTPVEIDSSVQSWLEQSLILAEDTEGAVDITVGPIARLWDIGGDNPRVPSEIEIQEKLGLVDYRTVQLTKDHVYLPKSGQKLDLGALGKGIGADIAKDILDSEKEAEGAVISVGGSILVYGSKPDKTAWKVGIQNPRGESEGDALGVLSIKKTCNISTSGDYEKYLEIHGNRYHHIMDPHTGAPANSDVISVTVVTSSGLVCDGLSTACLILGYENSIPLLEKYKAEAIFVDSAKQIRMTDGIKNMFELIATEYQIVE